MESLSIFCLKHLYKATILVIDLTQVHILQTHITRVQMASPFLLQASSALIFLTFFKFFKRLHEERRESIKANHQDSVYLAMRGPLTHLDVAERGDTALPSFLLDVASRIFESRPVSKFRKNVFDRGRKSERRSESYSDFEQGTPDFAMKKSVLPVKVMPVEVQEESCPLSRAAAAPESDPSPSPSPLPPAPTASKRTPTTGPYKAVRVLFLAWECERYQPTPCNVLVNKLRRLLGMTYHFAIQECTLPATGIQSENPDLALLSYLLSSGLLAKSVDHHNSDEPFNELVMVIYSGSGAIIDGRYHLVTRTDSGGIKKMSWGWFETRLASARYDSLCILNSSFVPETPVTTQKVRGSNMVLAAVGPETSFRREVLDDLEGMKKEGRFPGAGAGRQHGAARSSWTIGFLETILNELEESYQDTDGKVSVEYLFRRLVLDHDGLFLDPVGGRRDEEEIKRPFLGYVRGKEAEKDRKLVEIGLERANGSRGRDRKTAPSGEDWTWVDGV